MKKWKSLIVLFIVLVFAMSMLVACRPADDEEDFGDDGTSATGGNTQGGEQGGNIDGKTSGDETTGGTTGDNTGGTTGGTTGDNTGGNTTGGTVGDNTGGDKPGKDTDPTEAGSNPLLLESKKFNTGAGCSFDLDKTGFCKKATLKDLNGKTLTLFTGVDYGIFDYYNEKNKKLNEWDWFKLLKKQYGVTIKYVRCSPGGSNVVKPFQAMSAGKDCDLITTHVSSYPYCCNILAPLDDYCNMDKLTNSPGLDPQLTKLTKWKGKYIALGPVGANGAFNYNKTFIVNCGLQDPYTLFQKGQWNWTNFKKYMNGLPATNNQGKTVWGCATWGQYWYWANTNGKACFEINGDDPNGGIINNWDTPEVKETFVWLESVCDTSNCLYHDGSAHGAFWNHADSKEYCCMSYGMAGVNVKGIEEEENRKNEYFWVPFPKNEKNKNAVNHVEVYGFGIGIPRQTNKESNRLAAVKFCELWCTRFTEARIDGLRDQSKWTYQQVRDFYEFTLTNGRFGLGSGVGKLSSYAGSGSTGSKFNLSIADRSYSTSSCMTKLSNYCKQEVNNVLKFGVK